jgi:hypothetical protein
MVDAVDGEAFWSITYRTMGATWTRSVTFAT